jgi:hypothetical protein
VQEDFDDFLAAERQFPLLTAYPGFKEARARVECRLRPFLRLRSGMFRLSKDGLRSNYNGYPNSFPVWRSTKDEGIIVR